MAAAALALCLFLTGCYQPLDDTTYDTGSQTSNQQPYNTATPTPVMINPDSPTPGTQAPQPQTGNQGGTTVTNPPSSAETTPPPAGTATDTPAPGATGSGWELWTDQPFIQLPGTTAPGVSVTINLSTETPVPGAATTPPAPVATTPAFTQAPKSIQLGFKGEQVKELQKRLKELGYYKGSVDGDFGEKTEEAVKDFQKANKLTADGKVGENTLKKLRAKDAVTYKQAHATPTPKPTPKPTATPKPTPKPTATPNLTKDYYLTKDSSGRQVEQLQRRLIELGWLSGKVTGKFDEATEMAVRAFQRRSNLYEDGIAGPNTLRAIYTSGAAKSSRAVASAGETLEFGSEGSGVRTLQQKLKDLGYLSGTVDGKFGIATQAAVIAFQRNNGLTADGKAGTATLNKLYSGNAKKASGNAPKIEESDKKKSGRDTSNIASTGFETLENGSENSAVRKLQQRLKDLNYYSGSVDGKFGDATEAAVMAFQQQNHLTVDGKAGPATQRVLYSTGAQSPSMYTSIQRGESGDRVRNLQYTLYELGYYDGSIDGDFGQTTEDAVRAFQIRNSLKVDGIAGKETLAALYSSGAIAATTPQDEQERIGYGATGEIVQEIQDCLIEWNYMTEEQRSGTYDEVTVEAVKKFQADKGMTVDGVCGPQTLELLLGSTQY